MNTAILIGNLGEEPELREAGGSPVLKLRVATTGGYKDKEGNWRESTQWHSVVVWGPRASAIAPLLHKGSKIGVRGEIQYRSWDKDDGSKGYATEIRADEVTLCGSKSTDVESAFPPRPSTGGAAKPRRGAGKPAAPVDDNLPY